MPVRREAAKSELIEQVVALVGERLGRRAPAVARFVRQGLNGVDPDDLLARKPDDVYGAVLALWHTAQHRSAGEPLVTVYAPDVDQHGWQSPHTVVDVVTDDMPFLVDSVTMELNRHRLGIHLVVHPILRVRRDHGGALLDVLEAGDPGVGDLRVGDPRMGDDTSGDCLNEAYIHIEVDRLSDPVVTEQVTADLLRVLGDVRAAVEDWSGMRDRAGEAADEISGHPPDIRPEDAEEAAALMQWLRDDHFTFLGYGEYELRRSEGEDVLCSVPGTGLGILRDSPGENTDPTVTPLSHKAREVARARRPLVLTKANAMSTVHRPARLDYIGVKRFDSSGEVRGERRFLGLYTEGAYGSSSLDIPVVRRKVEAVVRRAGFPAGSHAEKNLLAVLETYPRDELFQADEDELYEAALGISRIEERKQVRLFARRDLYGRFYSCLVFLPRERYNTAVRLRMEAILLEAFQADEAEYTVYMSESVLVRLHYVLRTPGLDEIDVALRDVEKSLAEASRSWDENLHDALVERCGEEDGVRLYHRYRNAFPAAYAEDFSARSAVVDIVRIERVASDGGVGMSLWHPIEAPDDSLRFKLVRCGPPISLSEVLPLLENMGVSVVDEHPYDVHPDGVETTWIYDFGLRLRGSHHSAVEKVAALFQDAFGRVWRGEADNDGFNRLVLLAGLDWRQVLVLRAATKYLRQAGTTFSQAYIEDTLSAHPGIARRLVELFEARFDPAAGGADGADTKEMVASIESALDKVESLDEDRILRSFLHLIQALLRTNFFRRNDDGSPRPYLSFKVDPSGLSGVPLPVPAYEVFVYSPRTEAVHLRGAKVARGGIRWSDRREDFRTEVLGLMKAQTVKNAVIVPRGAKGGFVVKRPPAGGDRDALRAEVVACYEAFISGLLDLTDDLVNGKPVPPPDTVRYDDEDTYLVVAADKGTAGFSDIANAIAVERGYWLGDAFASGGSSGYDHKKMGITARGAWEAVKWHFHELGLDPSATDFTVVGIGDMSGDVFGNGMLLSRHIRLVAAFDHRHIFIDPDPDPERSFAERSRVFGLPRSTWEDYDADALSPGGGVFPRTAKSITLSPEARRALGVEEETLAPNEVIRAVLRAPVELLWNGGIGTYVKASTEPHGEARDRANDGVRVNASELRCRVVAEGGNLGFTQRGRVEYALAGGLINTDAVDNSAGVDCSDHEVNLKVLLDCVVADGDMTVKQRNRLLADMTDEVAEHVLRHNYEQSQALSNSRAQAAAMVDVHARYIRRLVQTGRIDRDLEFLPSDDALGERRAEGTGLSGPEFAVLLAYTKIHAYDDVLDSDVPDDPFLAKELAAYFPSQVRERFAEQIARHPLRREIITTSLTNVTVNRAGTSFLFRMGEETGSPVPDIIRAHVVAREIFGLRRLWADIEACEQRVDAGTRTAMLLEARKVVERATRWLLRNRRQPLDMEETASFFAPGVAELAGRLPELVVGSDLDSLEKSASELRQAGVPEALALRIAGLTNLYSALDITEVASQLKAPAERVAAVYFLLGERLEFGWLRAHIVRLPRADRWAALSRGALRDDLYRVHAALTADVLRHGDDGRDGAALVETWTQRNHNALKRSMTLLGDIKASTSGDLPALCAALREVRDLVESRHLR